MRCNDCTHYDVCYQYDIIGEDDNEMCALYEQKRKHGEWKKESAIDYLTEIGWLPEHDRILTERPCMTEEACESMVKLIEKIIEILPDIVESVTANIPEAIEQYIESKIRNGKEEIK